MLTNLFIRKSYASIETINSVIRKTHVLIRKNDMLVRRTDVLTMTIYVLIRKTIMLERKTNVEMDLQGVNTPIREMNAYTSRPQSSFKKSVCLLFKKM